MIFLVEILTLSEGFDKTKAMVKFDNYLFKIIKNICIEIPRRYFDACQDSEVNIHVKSNCRFFILAQSLC